MGSRSEELKALGTAQYHAEKAKDLIESARAEVAEASGAFGLPRAYVELIALREAQLAVAIDRMRDLVLMLDQAEDAWTDAVRCEAVEYASSSQEGGGA